MIKIKLITLILSIVVFKLFAEEKTVQSTADKFARESHTFKGTTLPYRIFIPEGMDVKKKYPLVLALHGLGECGSDNNMQITANKMATSWAEPAIQSKNPCYVIAPQCPSTYSNWTSGPVVDVLFNMVDSALAKYNIDKDRVYITGLSLGGNGTWNCLCLRPDLFAAAVPIAGWGNTWQASLIKDIPIWNFHGQADNVVTVANSRNMVEAFTTLGIDAVYTNCYYLDTRIMPILKFNNEIKAHSSLIYTELYGYSHDVWDYAYNNKTMFDWVFSKRRFIHKAINLTSLVKDTIVKGSIPIKWNTMFANDSVEIWFKSERQEYWKMLTKVKSDKKSFNWNTDVENECIYGKLRLCLLDSNSRVYSQSESGWTKIDQAGNGKPYAKLKTPAFYKYKDILSKSLNVNYIANDVEKDSVRIYICYSINGGKTYSKIDSAKVPANYNMKMRNITFSNLTNTKTGVLKLQVYDEKGTLSSDSTILFSNQLGLFPVNAPLPLINNGYTISEPYPNPANKMCTISLDIPTASEVSIYIYNTLGQLVTQKNEGLKNSGKQNIQLETDQLPEGIYYYTVVFGTNTKSKTIQKSSKLNIQH